MRCPWLHTHEIQAQGHCRAEQGEEGIQAEKERTQSSKSQIQQVPSQETGEKRGRPRKRANEKYVPTELSNGDTKVELFTRVNRVLPQSGEKWSESQKNRANIPEFGIRKSL